MIKSSVNFLPVNDGLCGASAWLSLLKPFACCLKHVWRQMCLYLVQTATLKGRVKSKYGDNDTHFHIHSPCRNSVARSCKCGKCQKYMCIEWKKSYREKLKTLLNFSPFRSYSTAQKAFLMEYTCASTFCVLLRKHTSMLHWFYQHFPSQPIVVQFSRVSRCPAAVITFNTD